MKNILKPDKLPWIVLGSGLLGLLLRLHLMGTEDAKGLLASGHPAELILWILTGCVLALLLYGTRNLLEADKYFFNFPASLPGGIGTLLAAMGIAITSLIELYDGADFMGSITAWLGIIAALALILAASCRWKGYHPSRLCYAAVCLYLMVRLIFLYRHWSADPQLQDYCFQILAAVFLMLAAYHRAAFAADAGKRRPYAFFNLASIYFCCLSLTSPEHIPLYLGAGVWMLMDLCSLIPAENGQRTSFRRKQVDD